MNNPYKILFVFPTRSRPQRALFLLKQHIHHIEDKENFTIHLNCDIDDETMNNESIRSVLDSFSDKNIKYFFNENKTKVEAHNINVNEYDWDIVVGLQDDLFPIVKGFDNIIRNEMKNAFNPDLDGVLFLFDGGLSHICTTPCMGRKFYDRFKYISYPGYKSLFGDNELTEVSTKLDRLKRVENIILMHHHPSRGNVPYDELYRKNDSFWDEDELLFTYRKNNNFFLGGI